MSASKSLPNPFHAGGLVSVEDRVVAVRSFGRAQIEAALKVEGLQATVAKAIQARQRFLARVNKVLHFEDHGQDFLRWSVDHKGKVIECMPFQAFAWCGVVVRNVHTLRKGSIVQYDRYDSRSTFLSSHTIKYPLARVVKGDAT